MKQDKLANDLREIQDKIIVRAEKLGYTDDTIIDGMVKQGMKPVKLIDLKLYIFPEYISLFKEWVS
jgi:hypothetical protein